MRAHTKINPIGPFLQLFFAEHLVVHKRASAQTIASYRDTFRLLLQFMQNRTGIPPAALPLTAVDADCVLDFLNYVERDRGCSARSRNNRLAAIRTFFRFVSLRDPTSLGMITRIMAIPNKRCEKKLVGFLSRDEVKALIAAPDSRTWSGRRDHAFLLTLYNTGGRISEIIGLRVDRSALMLAPQIFSCSARAERSVSFPSGTKPRVCFKHGFGNSRTLSSFPAPGTGHCHATVPTTSSTGLSPPQRPPVQAWRTSRCRRTSCATVRQCTCSSPVLISR
jgi:site-specific recombinase XerC